MEPERCLTLQSLRLVLLSFHIILPSIINFVKHFVSVLLFSLISPFLRFHNLKLNLLPRFFRISIIFDYISPIYCLQFLQVLTHISCTGELFGFYPIPYFAHLVKAPHLMFLLHFHFCYSWSWLGVQYCCCKVTLSIWCLYSVSSC